MSYDIIKSLADFAGLSNIKINNAQTNPYVIPNAQPKDDYLFTSKLGTPVYSNIIFNASKVIKNKVVIFQWDDFRIDDCLITVSQSKKIVTTEIQGRDGTVKEYIGMDDFVVNVSGRFSGVYGVNPKDETRTLKEILSAGQPLEITNWWLLNLGITDLVITGFDIPQVEGEYSTQYFNFSAISDRPVEALITNQTQNQNA